jgi:hypothetical protein
MFEIASPATIFDMAEMGGARSQLHWAVVKEMWSGGSTWSLRHDGNLVGLFGLYPIEGGAEAWFNLRPDLGRSMLFVIRQIRLTLVSISYPEIVVLCTSAAGSRIAAASGFQFVEHTDRGELWHAGLTGREQGPGPGQATGGTAAAPHTCGSGASTG